MRKLTIKEYIKRIQLESKNGNYDDYVHVFEEYKSYLEGYLKEKPNDIEAVCQLAAVYFELRQRERFSIDILEKLLHNTGNEMSFADKARVYTNLAFFYEENGEEEKHLHHLKEAVALNADYPNAYDSLGRFYIENNCPDEAIPLFEKAISLSGNMKYSYNYGVALFSSGDIAKAKAVFEALLADNAEEQRIAYAYGVCCFYMGDKATAIQLADALYLAEIDDYITESELADLYFNCGEYAKHNAMYDGEPYALEVSWLAPYFYALKALGNFDKHKKKLAEVLSEQNKEIADAIAEEIDDTYTEADKADHIQHRQTEKDDIIAAYHKIKDTGYKPKIKIKLWCMSGCYLIDCPRHQ